MDSVNRIELFKTSQGWMAEFKGPQAAEIIALFDSNIIPTPYTPQADSGIVLSEISRRNPDCLVMLR